MARSSCKTWLRPQSLRRAFLKFSAAFRGSYSPSPSIDAKCMHTCAYCQHVRFFGPAPYQRRLPYASKSVETRWGQPGVNGREYSEMAGIRPAIQINFSFLSALVRVI